MSMISDIVEFLRSLFGYNSPKEPSPKPKNPFIDYGGCIVLPPPDSLKQCLMYCFLMESNNGDKSKLQSLVDARLNFADDSDYQYEVLTSDVMITVAKTDEDRSIPDTNKGFVKENELVAWILTVEKIRQGDGWVPNRVVWFIPYIAVDNSWALAAGREIFGFPKALGTFEIPEDPRTASTMTANVQTFKTFSENSQMELLEFFKLTQGDTAHDHGGGLFKDSKHAFASIKALFMESRGIMKDLSLRLCVHQIEDMVQLKQRWVFLKQFRAIDDSMSACYQAIVEGPFQVTGFHGGGFLEQKWTVNLDHLDGYPIGHDLGFTDGQQTVAGFWINIDFNALTGQELYRS